MPYEIEMERDVDRGLDRYRISLADAFTSADANELCDWMAAAAQNPTATFRIDVSRVRPGNGRPIATVLARSTWLRTRRRLDVVRRELTTRGAVVIAAVDLLAPPF